MDPRSAGRLRDEMIILAGGGGPAPVMYEKARAELSGMDFPFQIIKQITIPICDVNQNEWFIWEKI